MKAANDSDGVLAPYQFTENGPEALRLQPYGGRLLQFADGVSRYDSGATFDSGLWYDQPEPPTSPKKKMDGAVGGARRSRRFRPRRLAVAP